MIQFSEAGSHLLDAVAPIGITLTSMFNLTAVLQILVMVPANSAGRVLDSGASRTLKAAAVLGASAAGMVGVVFAVAITSLTIDSVDGPRLQEVVAIGLVVALVLAPWSFCDSRRWRIWLSTAAATAPLSAQARREIAFRQARHNNIRNAAAAATGMALSFPARAFYSDLSMTLDLPQLLTATCVTLAPMVVVAGATQMSPRTELARIYRRLSYADKPRDERYALELTRLLRLIDLSLSRLIRAKPEPLKSAYRLNAEGLIADVALAVHRRDIGDLAVTAAVRSCLIGALPLPRRLKHTLGSSGMDWFNSTRLLRWTLTAIAIVTPGLTALRLLLPIANS